MVRIEISVEAFEAIGRGSSGRPLPARLERVLTRSLGPYSIPPSATVLCSARRG